MASLSKVTKIKRRNKRNKVKANRIKLLIKNAKKNAL